MMAVGIETEPELAASRPTMFEGSYATGNSNNPNYAVSPDGQRFLMIKDDPASRGFHVVLNAFEGLEPLFEGSYATGNSNNPNYAVSPDGQRFLMIKDDPASRGFHVVLNAFEGLEPR